MWISLSQPAQESQRIAAMEDCLECMTRLLLVVPRQERKMLLRRGDAIQEALEQEKIDKRRLNNYQKLCAEHLFYAQVIEGSIGDKFDHKGRRKVSKERGKNSTKRPKKKC